MSLTDNLSFRRVYTLKAQTPILHFQYSQHGATLRATEVKPKLDSFIQSRAKDRIKPEWYIKEGESALNYKLRLEAVGKQEDITPPGDNKEYDIYYGNMSSKEKKDKAVIKHLIKGDVRMTVLCTIPELSQIIDEFIAEFFAVTNFGTMQNKGFGSYIVSEKEKWYNDEKNIYEALMRSSGSFVCYYFYPAKPDKTFKAIKTVCSLIKSGINHGGYMRSLLFMYMHDELGIGNEKACLKEEGMVPTDVGRHANEWHRNPSNHDPYYVRALLGVGEQLSFINDITNKSDKTFVKISCVDKDEKDESKKAIERLASPLFFKVIGEKVYFVTTLINEDIYGKWFEFSVGGRKVELQVPTEKELGDEFIDAFIEYCVDRLNGNKGENALAPFNKNQNLIKLINNQAILWEG
ncbi:MAG: hypothetical protein IJ298_03590 [Ruminococcus sp.]|nr:hypothetical protein [Ruminococcus sp.]